ncbi:MAG: site-specific DNA-methyltransferase [Promethearchaeia archaeon]
MLWFTKGNEYVFNLDPVRVPQKYPNKKHYKGKNWGQLSGNPLGKNPSDVWQTLQEDWESMFWDFPNFKSNHPEKTEHPCQFPIKLVERCVLALTNKEDYVLDPYCGVGSALIVGIKRKRKVIGVEKELDYVNIAKQRIRDFFDGKLKIRSLTKDLYKPKHQRKIPKNHEDQKTITEF